MAKGNEQRVHRKENTHVSYAFEKMLSLTQIREMQSKTTLKQYFPHQVGKKNGKVNNTLCWQGCGELGILRHYWQECSYAVQFDNSYQNYECIYFLTQQFLFWEFILTKCLDLHKMMYMQGYSLKKYKSQILGTTQIFLNRRLVYPNISILYSFLLLLCLIYIS